MSAENANMPALTGEIYFHAAADHPPPRGVKLLLHTTGNSCTQGQWMDDSNLDGWLPLPKWRKA